MTNLELFWIVLIGGGGTFLLRFMPFLWQSRLTKTTTTQRTSLNWPSILTAIGPAAIVALLVLAVYDSIDTTLALWPQFIEWLVGALGVMIGRRLSKGNLAGGVIGGVFAYGSASAMLMGGLS